MISLITLLFSCSNETKEGDINDTGRTEERSADFSISIGVESVTVLNAPPSSPVTLYDNNDTPLVTLISDEYGQAHFAYIPDEHITLDPSNFEGVSLQNGSVLQSGPGYYIQNESTEPPLWSGTFSVLHIEDVPDPSFYDSQTISGVHHSVLTGSDGDPEDGYQYIEMRDGVLLSAMVRFPDPLLYGEGPYPTVIEYSGYSPSRSDRMDAGTLISNALGFATVSVNMRGSGCSGGVFDVFNPAQHADGYDLVEIVARQEWVLHNHVGMVGLSYPGISQLYVASTKPPSLAAIIPLSTIADAWEMQWPGGIYNKGFTRQWVEARENQAQVGGSSWVSARIEQGDETCSRNLKLSHHSVDFETFLRGLPMRPEDANARDLNQLVAEISCPVFYGGAFQDEQTGAQFGKMLSNFSNTDQLRVMISNGRHPDGFAPNAVFQWFEFLEFHLSKRIPQINPAVRIGAQSQFGDVFGMTNSTFPDDRFLDFDDYESALASYKAEPIVHVGFENGAGSAEVGAPVFRFQKTFNVWPPTEYEEIQWFLGSQAAMTPQKEETSGIDLWMHDAEASEINFFGSSGYQVLTLLWDLDWTRFSEGHVSSYRSDVFTEPVILSAPGILNLWVRSPVDEIMIQATLTEIRPDDMEVYIQSGWLRVGHTAEESGLLLLRDYDGENFRPPIIDEWTQAQIEIPSFAHPMRAGSRLQLSISSPGRDHGTWQFETPNYEENPTFQLGYGGDLDSNMRLRILPNIEIPEEYPPCTGLRGQPCRSFLEVPNQSLEE
jgi:predicted acyl esterase